MVINQTNKHKAKIYNYCAYTKIIIKKIYFFSSQCIRMSGNSIDFDKNKIKISTFYENKNKKNTQYRWYWWYGKNNSFKYFIGYNNNDLIRPLIVTIPQTNSYINKFKDKKTKTTTTMSLMVKDKQLFKNYNKIWKRNRRFKVKKIW